MESNRDEAERCISIALAAAKANQPDKARRFLEKAQRLYPSQRVRGERRAGARREARGSAACAAAAGPDLSPSPRLRSARGARRESEFLGCPGGCPGVSGRGTGWDRISPEAGYRLGAGTDRLGSGTAGPPPLRRGPGREGAPAPRCCGTPEPRARHPLLVEHP